MVPNNVEDCVSIIIIGICMEVFGSLYSRRVVCNSVGLLQWAVSESKFCEERRQKVFSHWYRKDIFLKTYNHYLEVMNGYKLWTSMENLWWHQRIRKEGKSKMDSKCKDKA